MPNVFGYDVSEVIETQAELRGHYNPPSRFVNNKVIDQIDDLAARFIAQTGLIFLSTQRPDGQLDVSPRGDPSGFLKVLTPTLLALPDRPGNQRVDAYENILENPQIGLICVIPGHRDTLRISGEGLAISGKPAQSMLLIKVKRVLCHCPKAFVRGGVWSPEKWPDTSNVPSLAEMMCAHSELADSVSSVDDIVRRDGENRLY